MVNASSPRKVGLHGFGRIAGVSATAVTYGSNLSRLRGWIRRLFPRTLSIVSCLAIAILAGEAPAAEPPASSSAADFPGVIWKNRLAEDEFWNKNGWLREDSSLSIPKDQAFCAFPEKLADAAIRVRFRYDGPGGSFIDLILRSDGKAANIRYVATTFIGKEDDHRVSTVIRCKDETGKTGGLVGKNHLASLKPGDEHTLEFYAKGDRLAYYLDGQLVVSFHDSKLAEGQTCLFTGSQLHFLSVETAELPKAPALAGNPITPSKPAAPKLPSITPGVAVMRATPAPQPPNPPPAVAMLPATPQPVPPPGVLPGFGTPAESSTSGARGQTPATLAGTPAPTADDFRNVPTIDPYQLSKDPFKYDGKVVKLKFTARVYDLSHENGESRGRVGVRVGRTWYNINVVFPSGKDDWFMKFSNNVSGPYAVYVRISSGGSPRTATIIGREVHSGANGPEIVW
jgi:hypothetical protein